MLLWRPAAPAVPSWLDSSAVQAKGKGAMGSTTATARTDGQKRRCESVRGAAGLVAGEATTERDAWRKSGVGVRENPEFGVQFN